MKNKHIGQYNTMHRDALYDDYGENSSPYREKNGKVFVKMPHESLKEWAEQSGPCITIVPAREK